MISHASRATLDDGVSRMWLEILAELFPRCYRCGATFRSGETAVIATEAATARLRHERDCTAC